MSPTMRNVGIHKCPLPVPCLRASRGSTASSNLHLSSSALAHLGHACFIHSDNCFRKESDILQKWRALGCSQQPLLYWCTGLWLNNLLLCLSYSVTDQVTNNSCCLGILVICVWLRSYTGGKIPGAVLVTQLQMKVMPRWRCYVKCTKQEDCEWTLMWTVLKTSARLWSLEGSVPPCLAWCSWQDFHHIHFSGHSCSPETDLYPSHKTNRP